MLSTDAKKLSTSSAQVWYVTSHVGKQNRHHWCIGRRDYENVEWGWQQEESDVVHDRGRDN